MPNHKSNLAVALAAIMILTASPSWGQLIYGQPISGHLRPIYSHWSLETDSTAEDISQLTIPVSGFIPLQDNLELRFFTATASSKLESGDEEYTFSGMSDLRLQINSAFSDDRFLLSAGFNLPTGKKKLSHEDEQPVMALLTQNYLSFPSRRLGEGFGLNLLAGAAITSGTSRLGGTVMYQLNGSYEAYEGDGDYTPGNMFSASANADTRSGNLILAGDIIFTTFGTDKYDGRKVFKQSDQLELRAGAGYALDNYGFDAELRYFIRGRNDRFKTDETLDYRLKVYGNEFSAAGRFTYRPGPNWYLAPLFDLRLISGNEFEDERRLGNANNIGFGFDLGYLVAAGFDFGIGFKYYTGSADGGNIDLSGYQLSAGITASL